MKDIHSHLLPAIDDGSASIEESVKLLKELEAKGVTDIVLTPHYVNGSKYNCNVIKKHEKYLELSKSVYENNIGINLYLGNEIFIDDDLLSLLQNKEVESINNSKYLLIEFSLYEYPKYAIDLFKELMSKGYKVILAHPERYSYMDFKMFDELKEIGILFQGNYLSLYDKYGHDARKKIKKLLKKGYISFLASDIHHSVDLDLKKLKRKLRWYIKKSDIEKLLNENIEKVIKNLDI